MLGRAPSPLNSGLGPAELRGHSDLWKEEAESPPPPSTPVHRCGPGPRPALCARAAGVLL